MQNHHIDPADDSPFGVDPLAHAMGAPEEIFDEMFAEKHRVIAEDFDSQFGPACPKCGKRDAEYQQRSTVDKWCCRSCNWTWFQWQGRGK